VAQPVTDDELREIRDCIAAVIPTLENDASRPPGAVWSARSHLTMLHRAIADRRSVSAAEIFEAINEITLGGKWREERNGQDRHADTRPQTVAVLERLAAECDPGPSPPRVTTAELEGCRSRLWATNAICSAEANAPPGWRHIHRMCLEIYERAIYDRAQLYAGDVRDVISAVQEVGHWRLEKWGEDRFADQRAANLAVMERLAAELAESPPGAVVRPVADRIRDGREVCGITQAQLAEVLGVTQKTVWRWEHGEALPSRVHCHGLAGILGGRPHDYQP
jgi:DNA-binding XRE family transcriptional regulator